MSVKKFYATADTTITNAYKENLRQRGTDANMGLSDALEVFFIYGQNPKPDVEADKLEEARILVKFDTDSIKSYYNDVFPTTVKFVLKLTNAVHPFTLARNYDVNVYALAEGFIEGNGLDMESYKDEDVASWTNRIVSTAWTTAGALQGTETLIGTQRFDTGEEDLEVDITTHIQSIFDGTTDNGFAIVMDGALTSGAQEQNFYTKKFFSRSSEFFFKRPAIEARDASRIADDRGKFYAKRKTNSSLQNTQRVYLYNSFEGVRSDFTAPEPDEELYVRFYTDEARTTQATLDPDVQFIQAVNESTGVYYVDVILDESSVSKIYDQWYFAANGGTAVVDRTLVHEGEITIIQNGSNTNSGEIDYVIDITNLKTSYTRQETAKFRIYTRQKDWNPTIYTVASKEIENLIVEKIYYKIVRLVDEETVLDYGIGTDGTSNEHTLVSYDALGSYFDFDMSLLEKGYMYGIKLMFSINGELREQEEIFKFRVD
tara:strand:+ start:3444 stop:4904 length:1461 start_codon:yes stop_codon:yes gene_type:complete